MTKSIAVVLVGAGVVLLWRWAYVWRQARLSDAAFEHRIRNRQDLWKLH